MAATIKAVLDDELSHITVDRILLKKIVDYERSIANKNQSHVEFLSGNLLGTPRFRVFVSDLNVLFDEVLEVDDEALKQRLHSLKAIVPSRVVSSDVFNLSIVYLTHLIYTSNLSFNDKELCMVSLLKILHYKFLGSLLSVYIPYEPNKALVEAVYISLSNKFSLKQQGSWGRLIDFRCKDIISSKSIHRKTIEKFDNDDKVLFYITDVQTRIRQIIKHIIKVFYALRENPLAYGTTTSIQIDEEGNKSVKDIIRKHNEYLDYSKSILRDKNTFIKQELINIILDIMRTIPEKQFAMVLEYTVENYYKNIDKDIELLVDKVIIYAFDYLRENEHEHRSGIVLSALIAKLRGQFMASRSTNPDMLELRDVSFNICKRASKSVNASMIAALRTGLMLYIVLRVFTKSHYTN